jgi:hypothetical protein
MEDRQPMAHAQRASSAAAKQQQQQHDHGAAARAASNNNSGAPSSPAVKQPPVSKYAQQHQRQRSAAAAAAAAAAPAAAPGAESRQPLSAALQTRPEARCDGVKLSAVSCQVTHIDPLPPACLTCGVVYLSNNSLRSLEGVGQFGALRVLGCGNNLLARFDDLLPLRACAELEVGRDGSDARL